jgi:hypothetical protein
MVPTVETPDMLLSINRRITSGEVQDGVVAVEMCRDSADVRVFAVAFTQAKAAGPEITMHLAKVITAMYCDHHSGGKASHQ